MSILNKNYWLCSMHLENCMLRNEQNNHLKPDAILTLFESTSEQHTIENYVDDNHGTVNDVMFNTKYIFCLFKNFCVRCININFNRNEFYTFSNSIISNTSNFKEKCTKEETCCKKKKEKRTRVSNQL